MASKSRFRTWGERALALSGVVALACLPSLIQMTPEAFDANLVGWQRRLVGVVSDPYFVLALAVISGAVIAVWFLRSGDPQRVSKFARNFWHNVTRDPASEHAITFVGDALASGSPTDALNRELQGRAADKDALYAARYGIQAARDRQEREIFGATATEIAAARSVDPLNEIAPIPMTNDEAQLLSELRRFIVLLQVCDEKLTVVTRTMLAWDWQKKASDPTMRVLHHYFAFHVEGRQPNVAELKRMAAEAKSRTDITNMSIRIAHYLEHNYAERQRAIGSFNAAIKEDLAAYPQTKEWLDSELRCLEQWEAIRMSPAHEHLVPFDRQHFGHRGNLYRRDGG